MMVMIAMMMMRPKKKERNDEERGGMHDRRLEKRRVEDWRHYISSVKVDYLAFLLQRHMVSAGYSSSQSDRSA